MDTWLQDVRYAARRLRHAPTFTVVVVLTLALGIGANSAIFSVVDQVLLRPLPYPRPAQLVTLYHYYPGQKLEAPVSVPGFRDYRDRTRAFSSLAVQAGWNVTLTGADEPQRIAASRVSGLYFSTLGVGAALGRTVTADDDQPGHEKVAVLSDRLWKRVFGARRDIVGQSIVLNAIGYQVIGVMPPDFVDPWNRLAELWGPIAIDPARFVPSNYTNEFLNVVARLRPTVTPEAAAREMTGLAAQLRKDYPAYLDSSWGLEVKTLTQVQTGTIRSALLILLGAVGFVLLIACANVANLLLVRAASRRREVAVRTALGARLSHLVRQMLAESLILSLLGAALGLGMAYAILRGLSTLNLSRLPRMAALTIDAPVLAFTLGLATLAAIAFGLGPAMQVWRTNLQGTLKDNARGGTGDRRSRSLRRGLVVAQTALALTLLTGGGLLIKSFSRVAAINPGFRADHVLTFSLALPSAKYRSDTARVAFWTQVIPRLMAVPGVRSVGATTNVPFGGAMSTGSFNVEGYTPPPKTDGPWGDLFVATPGYFRTLDVAIRRGREFTAQDDVGAPRVAVVDQEFVRRFFPNDENPVGRRLYFGGPIPDSATRYITIVGVVGHVVPDGLDATPRTQLYLPATQAGGAAALDVVVRTSGDPLQSLPALRAAVHELDRDLPLARATAEIDNISASMGQRRLSTILLGAFAGLALLLASLGIYGVMSYTVAQRIRELGIRLALGASRESVLRLVLREGTQLAAAGVGIGLIGALVTTRVLNAQLYAVNATDPVIFLSVTLLLLVVAVSATLVPALRAMRVDPIVALREE